jgi:hypothetical protein
MQTNMTPQAPPVAPWHLDGITISIRLVELSAGLQGQPGRHPVEFALVDLVAGESIPRRNWPVL